MKILRPLLAAGILALLLTLFPEARETFSSLHASWAKVLASGELSLLFRRARTPRAGEQVLPPVVRAGISLLRAHRVTMYRFSPAFEKDEEVRQRLVEGAFPIRSEKHARYLLLLEQESPDRSCSPVSRGGGVVLVHCP